MAIVDERGRVFGRWNLLDVAVLVLLLGLIPLGYAAFVLFRERPPRLLAVEPTQLRQADLITLRINGENFRAYMRLSLGTYQGREFQFKSTEEAEVQFASVPPGKYDVVLYDQGQERSRLTQALTISPSDLPSTQIVAVGAFVNLDAAGAAKLTVGTTLGAVGEIVAVGKPVPDFTEVFSGSTAVGVPLANALRLPAVVRFNCYIRDQQGSPFCTVNEVTMAPKNLLRLTTPLGVTPFQVQRARSPEPLQPVKVTLRVAGLPAVLSKIKAGDIDTGGIDNDAEVVARVANAGAVRVLNPSSAEVDVTLTANLQHVNGSWLYDSAPLRLGASLLLRTAEYQVAGTVTGIGTPRE